MLKLSGSISRTIALRLGEHLVFAVSRGGAKLTGADELKFEPLPVGKPVTCEKSLLYLLVRASIAARVVFNV